MADYPSTLPNPHEPTKPFTIVILNNIVKLNQTNYIVWKASILATLEGYDLDGYVLGTVTIPAKTLTDETSTNPAYRTYTRQDRLIYGALIGTLSNDVASFVTNASTHPSSQESHIASLEGQVLRVYLLGQPTWNLPLLIFSSSPNLISIDFALTILEIPM